MTSSQEAPKPVALTATYASSNNASFTNVQPLPALQSSAPKERTEYLAALKRGVVEMQEAINKELTSRMEDDKANETGKATVDDKKEEDNYGEEVVEEKD